MADPQPHDTRSRRLIAEVRRRLHLHSYWDRWVRSPLGATPPTAGGAWCTICRWKGEAFQGVEHCESAVCPRCGSIARDRFLLSSFAQRPPAVPGRRKLRVIETSPRLGPAYQRAMHRWFDYLPSDFEERSHKGAIRLDLQAIDLPDDSVDVVLSSHVLEHVPQTATALAELHRIIRPGGVLYLQVPILQGATAPPTSPEYHGDDTLVHWRFGWDLASKVEEAGFAVTTVVPATFPSPGEDPGPISGEFDVDAIVARAPRSGLERLGDARTDRLLGWRPAYMFATFEGVVSR
jgi:SAM-dependent methyltransferase